MLKELKMDLHVHTCLSPCGNPENVPTRIVDRALAAGLDAIAVSDHNTGENAPAVRIAAKGRGLHVFPGMELSTREEVHLLLLFQKESDLSSVQEAVYSRLQGENNPDFFGEQYIVDEEDYVTGTSPRLLIGAVDISLEEAIGLVHEHSGLVIASHIDRGAFSLVSQLGFVPENLALDAVEFSPHYKKDGSEATAKGYPWVTFSDAHSLEDIGKAYSTFLVSEPSVSEIKKALTNREGRRVVH